MGVSSFGASAGPGPVHCVLLDIEDGRIVGRQARTIDPGPYRLGRRGNLLSSGFDLLASHSERTVDASAVAARSRRDLLSVRCGARGGVRSAGIVRESDAVLRALDERGLIARYPTVMIANLGAGGLRVYTVSDGAVTGVRRARGVVVDGPDAGVGAAHGVAEFVHATIGRAAAAPEAVVLVGGGAQNTGVREAVADIARAAGAEPLSVDEPEAIVATGAALLAADRRTAGTPPSSLVGSGIGGLGGYSVRLTAAVLPLLVIAALTAAVLATGFATGIIGPAGQTTDEVVPTSADVRTSEEVASTSDVEPPTSAVASTLPPADTLVPTSVPRDTGRDEVTPTMTTFAPPPVHPTTTTAPWPTPPPSVPSRTLPTTILPSVPTGTPSGTPSPTGPGTPPAESSGQNPPPGSGLPPSGEILPGSGLFGPRGGAPHPDGAASADASPVAPGRIPGAAGARTAPAAPSSSEAPTVTTPAP